MDFCKVIFRRAITQYRSCRRTNCTQKIFNSNINTNPCINCNYPNKLSSICGQKFPNYDFTENYHSHDFTNGYFKKFHSDNAKSSRTSALKKLIVGGVLVGSVTYLINKNRESVSTPIGEYSSEYPDFTPEQVAKHKTRTTGIWVTYNKGVYDVTDLINKDPEGTDHYLISAGGPVYSFSTANNQPDEETFKVLENYRIDPKVPVGEYKSGLPEYTMEQVAQHKTRETKVWMSYKQGIYDVTDYIKQHPGGEDNVMMAAGGPLEPYWSIYTQHHVDSVFGLLEKYRIGNLKPSVTPKNVCFVADIPGNPFEHEPQRDSRMIPITERPFNGGVKGATLTQSFITPNEIFYVRNHLPVPYLKEEEYKLTVEVEGLGSKTFTLDDLKKLPQVTRMLSLQCGGLRRQEMTDLLKKDTQGVKWEINGVGNAVWTGVLLIDVMKAAGFKESMEELEHLQFTSGMSAGGPYVTGIPIYRVLNPKNNIMLAWEMNGKKLHPDHGLPLRVVVPGLIGAKSVKQIEKIEVRKQECQAHWHQQLYKYFGPYVTLDNVDYSSQPPVTELPVMSAILSPADKDTVSQSGGTIPIKGFAYSGGGCKIVRVDVSANRGKTWMPAKITDNAKDPAPYHFTWSLWQVDVPTNGKKCVDVWVKAVDSSGNTQPEFWEHIYNIRGVACTAYHKIRVNVK